EEEPRDGVEGLALKLLGRRLPRARGAQPEQPAERRVLALRFLGGPVAELRRHLGAGRFHAVTRDEAEVQLQHGDEREVGHRLPERGAAALEEGHTLAVEPAPELVEETRLAEPRLA